MTREEMKELNGLAASMGLYDDKKPCKRAVILGKAIKELEQKPRWIPISENLPEEGGNYLVTNVFEIVKGENPVKEVRRDYFCVLSQKWLYEGDNVIAWMPLPKRYEPQESENNK